MYRLASCLRKTSETWAPVIFNSHHRLDCIWNQVWKKKFKDAPMRGFSKRRTDPECGRYLQWAGILGWIKRGMGKESQACVTWLPDQGSGCPGFPSMMDLLSNQKPTADSSLHFFFFLMGIWSQQKAKRLIQHVFPFWLWPRHSTKHALIRTVIKACSWTLPFFCFLPPFTPSLSMLSSVINP